MTRLDPESEAGLADYLATAGPPGGTLRERREQWDRAAREDNQRRGNDLLVSSHDMLAPGTADVRVPLRVYRPRRGVALSPAILLIHGGGMVMGSLETEDRAAREICSVLDVVVVSVGYRLAPEHPYPAALNDCADAYAFLRTRAADLKIDPDRLAVVGGSAGGGLALALALRLRDLNRPLPRLVLAAYPMLDDRRDTQSMCRLEPMGIWDQEDNEEAWTAYLGGVIADQYAAPARAESLAELPPVFLDVGDHDLFRDEAMLFASRLTQAGVPTEFHLYPGAFHASEEVAPNAALSQRIMAARYAALERAFRAGR